MGARFYRKSIIPFAAFLQHFIGMVFQFMFDYLASSLFKGPARARTSTRAGINAVGPGTAVISFSVHSVRISKFFVVLKI